jgi:hypothetical protein
VSSLWEFSTPANSLALALISRARSGAPPSGPSDGWSLKYLEAIPRDLPHLTGVRRDSGASQGKGRLLDGWRFLEKHDRRRRSWFSRAGSVLRARSPRKTPQDPKSPGGLPVASSDLPPMEEEIIDNAFIRNVCLLLLTALLTGLLVPYLLKVIDNRKAMRQQERASALARQAKIIEDQAQFLDNLAVELWKWRYMSIRLTYYGGQGMWDRFKEADDTYNREFWEVLHHIRSQIGRAKRLISDHAYQRLLSLYKNEIINLDNQICNARNEKSEFGQRAAFVELNEYIFENVTAKIDEELDELSSEIKLKTTVSNDRLR